MRTIYPITAILTLTVLAAAQEIGVQKLKQDVATAKVMGIMGAVMGPTVKGAPYSAVEVRENTQVLADGNRIDQTTRTTVYRDSEGRLRRETPDQITIWDPVNGTSYLLDPNTQTAHRMPLGVGLRTEGKNVVRFDVRAGGAEPPPGAPLPPPGVSLGAAGPPIPPPPPGAETFAVSAIGGAPGPQVVFFQGKQQHLTSNSESLGQQSIDGMSAQGTRITSTIAAGAIGNQRPIDIVSETWYSPELQAMVKSVHSDPRMGQDTFELTNISRAEPNPDLFQVPADYRITDGK